MAAFGETRLSMCWSWVVGFGRQPPQPGPGDELRLLEVLSSQPNVRSRPRSGRTRLTPRAANVLVSLAHGNRAQNSTSLIRYQRKGAIPSRRVDPSKADTAAVRSNPHATICRSQAGRPQKSSTSVRRRRPAPWGAEIRAQSAQTGAPRHSIR